MYNNIYQEYINNILGTRNNEQFNYDTETHRESDFFQFQSSINMELEEFYPELYKIIYPMIQTACMKNTKPITEETIDDLVKEIYSNFNSDDISNELRNDNKNNEVSKAPKAKNISESDNRSFRDNNFVLKDLIRILLIRELLGRPGRFPPNRPNLFPRPIPGGRPPFRPREWEYDIY